MGAVAGRRAENTGSASGPIGDAPSSQAPSAEDRSERGARFGIEFGPSVQSLESVVRAGLIDPAHLAALGWEATRWGPTLAAPVDAAARRFPNRTAVVDDFGRLTYGDLKRRSDRLAGGLVRAGFTRFDRIAVMCANHRGFVEALLATAKIGCGTVLVNPTLGGPQLTQVVEREGVSVVIHDADRTEVVAGAVPGALSVPADPARDSAWSFPTIEPAPLRRRAGVARTASLPVLMTSGTTGVPKGAERPTPPPDLVAATGLLQMIPYRLGDTAVIAAPLFHAWGLANLTMMLTLAGTVVLARRFDPSEVLHSIDRHRPRVLVVVPIMLSRMLDAQDTRNMRPAETSGGASDDGEKLATDAGVAPARTLSLPEVVAASGSAIRPGLVERWLSECGPNLYNLYGSTEVGTATVASPRDLAAHPATAGQVVPGSRVEILDNAGTALPAGEVGAIFVGSSLGFSQYTDGADKERIDGLVATGDTGYFNTEGCLFVLGRDDDMIVSGGENVFPGEVEDLLAQHADVDDVAVVAVADEEFGQRLAAHVVRRKGAKLTKAQVRKYVRSSLAPYKVPRDVHWVKALPRTTTGKVQRSRL